MRKQRSDVVDMLGKKYGRLLVIRAGPRSRQAKWVCRCDCGRESVARGSALRYGSTVSCGCAQREAASANAKISSRSHGATVGGASKEYRAWCSMKRRCLCKTDRVYPSYGGRGIRVHPAWVTSFTRFLRHIGPAPSSRHSVDRINNDGNYEPGNVRWATRSQQSRNRRDRRPVTVGGVTMMLVDWAAKTGIDVATLHSRLTRGWSVERAMCEPKHYRGK